MKEKQPRKQNYEKGRGSKKKGLIFLRVGVRGNENRLVGKIVLKMNHRMFEGNFSKHTYRKIDFNRLHIAL